MKVVSSEQGNKSNYSTNKTNNTNSYVVFMSEGEVAHNFDNVMWEVDRTLKTEQ